MRLEDFQSQSPGKLVPTAFIEQTQDGKFIHQTGSAFLPDLVPPSLPRLEILGRLFDDLDAAKTALLRLDALITKLPGKTVLLSAMRVREVQASSKIENTFASVRDVALAGVAPRPAGETATSSSQPLEVLRNRACIEHGLSSKLPVCVRLVREMHERLVVAPKHRPGKLRDKQVCIGDEDRGFQYARFVPPPGEHVPALMQNWENFCNPLASPLASGQRWPWLFELAIAHYQFETIHPFSDGNGRLGRALVTLTPIKQGELENAVCNLSEWVSEHKQEYYDRLLRVSTHADWEAWIRFFCTALTQQARTDTDRAKRVAALYDKFRKKLDANTRTSVRTLKLLDSIFDRQIVTATLAAKVMGVSHTAASRAVEKFVTMGIVKPASKFGNIQPFIAESVIRAIRGDGEE